MIAALALLACAEVRVVAATDLGPVEAEGIRARDGGYSVASGERSIWLYGDTILSAAGADGETWRDNSWAWTEDADASDGLDGFHAPEDSAGAPTEFFPETAEEAAYNAAHAGDPCAEAPCGAREILWPMAAVEDAARGRVLAFYVKIHGEPGAWNFFARGYGVAVWSDPDLPPERPVVAGPDPAEPTLLFTGEDEAFGVAAVAVGEDLYAYACAGEGGWGKPCRVARVPLAEVLDRGAWRFWDGEGWGRESGAAAVVFEGNAQATVHWSPFLERFVAVHMDGVSDALVMRIAPAPEGPWSEPVEAARALPAGEGWVYCGLAHPERQREGGRFELLSYYRPLGAWEGEVRLVEVELDR